MIFKIISFNDIQNYIIQLHSKSYFLIGFQIIFFNGIQNYIIQLHSTSCHSITFYIISFNVIQNQIFERNFNIIYIYRTALYTAVEKENIEIVKLLLTNEKLDINVLNILFYFL